MERYVIAWEISPVQGPMRIEHAVTFFNFAVKRARASARVRPKAAGKFQRSVSSPSSRPRTSATLLSRRITAVARWRVSALRLSRAAG